ncbi:hypothetical protein FACS189416_0640 [Bacteroidia bacterium]|nr:hypothetical protein FACS189416_0640 [Bacteroidia bacterium]
MRIYKAFIVVMALLLCGGCIKDEPLSPYADIDAFALPANIMLSPATINQNNITIFVRKNVDLTALVPTITLSEGATIQPSADIPQDFTRPVNYTVTAPDGKHQRIYTVELTSRSLYKYGFENWEVLSSNAYETPVEYDLEKKRTTPWDSSNKGINIYVQYPEASQYPIHKTTQHTEGQYAAEMLTKNGPGSILGIVNIPVVAGSLFTGVLTPLNALKDPLLATEFGQPIEHKPLRLTGKYIYKAGADYIDKKGLRIGFRDSCAVYSVFFRTDRNLERLNGTNILTHPNIVAIAMMPPAGRAGTPNENDFVAFDIPFDYKTDHVVDFDKNTYKLVIIFSSSYWGDYYEGAPGSHLVVDDVEIITEEIEE